MTPMVARCLGSESICLFLRNDERPFEVEGGDARRDEIVKGDYFPRGKVAGKVTSSSPLRKPARRGSIQYLLDEGVDPGPVCLLLDVLAAPPGFGY